MILIALFLVQVFIFEITYYFCKQKSALFKLGFSILITIVLVVPYYYFSSDIDRNKPTFIYELLALFIPLVVIHTIISGFIFNQNRKTAKRVLAYLVAVFLTFAYILYVFLVACVIGGSCL